MFDPPAPDTVHAGTQEGLWRSTNAGIEWTRASGGLGSVSIRALVTEYADERTILYAGVVGGVSYGETAGALGLTSTEEDGAILSGVYQQTVVHRLLTEKVYLPLILGGS